MTTDVITVEGLSKRYRREPAGRLAPLSFRELLSQQIKGLLGAGSPRTQIAPATEFWALKDITFSLQEGVRLGVVGRNGSGKSTLLRILSRITEPTAGTVKILGRTASLLEIGTGFHPELTGRENIYLNAALLGMGRQEVRRKLEQIVEFAEIADFIDEPVKHYSSGMYVRLAFSIAAHVDPDILILDEVLAVGDLRFQRKCIGKMEELGQSVRSVIFVSHDLAAISSLCNRCLVLDAGSLIYHGPTAQGIAKYYEQNPYATGVLELSDRAIGDGDGRLLVAEVLDDAGKPILETPIAKTVKIRMRYWISGSLRGSTVPNLHFFRPDGACAFVLVATKIPSGGRGSYLAEVEIPGNFLNEGMYTIDVALTTFMHGHYATHFNQRRALALNVRDPREVGGLRDDIGYAGEFPGAVRPQFEWTVERTGE